MGASIGLGMAFIENFLYLDQLNLIVIRNMSSNIIHILTSTINSYGIYKYKNTSRILWLGSYVLSVAIHYSYNIII